MSEYIEPELHQAIASWPVRVERAQHALTAFGVEGTVVTCEHTDARRVVASRGQHVPDAATVDLYALGLEDGRTLILSVEVLVAGGADADVSAVVTLLSGDSVLGRGDTWL